MFALPPSLAQHFRDASGRVDYLRLLRTPDDQLVSLAGQMSKVEWVDLYSRLRWYQPGFLERMAATAAGMDIESLRQRFVGILEQAAVTVAA